MPDKPTVASSRIVIFDLLRIILITLIVNIHIRIIAYTKPNLLEPFTWICVPLFLTLSFYLTSKYFLKERLDLKFMFSRTKRMFIPLLFWSLIGFLVHPELINIKNIILQIVTGEVVNVPLYYLNLIIIFTVIFWFLSYFKFKLRLTAYLAIILVAFLLQYLNFNHSLFSPTSLAIRNSYGRFVELIPYSVMGILFGLLLLKTKLRNGILLITTVVSIGIFILTLNFGKLLDFHYSGITLFSEAIFLFSLTLLLSKLKFSNFLNRIINTLGKYAFGVYLFHFILLEVLLKIFPDLKFYINNYSFMFLFVFVALCFAICIIFDKLTKHKLSFLIS